MPQIAEAHDWFGPAMDWWDGGMAGERKISQAKPLLGIKRLNADWQRLTMEKIVRLDTLRCISGKQDHLPSSRHLEGSMRIYPSRTDLIAHLNDIQPMSGILGTNGIVYVAYRPVGTSQNTSRSIIALQPLDFDDDKGQIICDLIYVAPIKTDSVQDHKDNIPNELIFDSLLKLDSFVDQYVLMLPMMIEEDKMINLFYTVGHQWTERITDSQNTDNTFVPMFMLKKLFAKWL
jgi:hypothetical protein